MPGRPYSFRFLFDAQTAYESLRDKLSDRISGSRSYDALVQRLSDRDRALEDHLNLGVSQGYLGIGEQTGGGYNITTSFTDIPGVTTTFTVPANRRLKVTSAIFVENVTAAAGTFVFTNVKQDGVVIRSEYLAHGAAGSTAGPQMHLMTFFYSPAAGTHTLNTEIKSLATTLSAATLFGNYISVEDIGPVTA